MTHPFQTASDVRKAAAPKIGTHLATLNLFREPGGDVQITVAEANGALNEYNQLTSHLQMLYAAPIDFVEMLVVTACEIMKERREEAGKSPNTPEDMKRKIAWFEADGEPKHFPPSHYVLARGTSSMVKVADFFEQQKREGLETNPKDKWFEGWKPVYVEIGDDPGMGIEAARELAAHMEPYHPHWKDSRLEPLLPDATALCPGASRYQECRGKWRSPIAS